MCDSEWEDLPPPAVGPGSETTFNSQSAFVYPFQLSDGKVIFNTAKLKHGTLILETRPHFLFLYVMMMQIPFQITWALSDATC